MIWLKQKLSKFALPFIFIMGLGLLTYPTISDYWNSFHQSEAIMNVRSGSDSCGRTNRFI